MTFLRALVVLLRLPGFRRLFVSRITSSASDGIFQIALAGHVLFNPEKNADARSIAVAFAVVLLPYSVLGPFAGVLLDRWPRRGVMLVTQLLRAVTMLGVAGLLFTDANDGLFFCAVLLVFSLNRFVLTGLSASLPHVVERHDLVSANAIAPTCGSLAYTLGFGVGGVIRSMGTDAVVALVAGCGVFAAAAAIVALPFVGPDDDAHGPHLGQVVLSVARGFVEAGRTLPHRAWMLLTLVFLTRLPMGLLLLQAVILFRGALAADGTRGLTIVGIASAVGFAASAFVTPWLSPRLGQVRYATTALLLGAVGVTCLAWPQQLWSVTAVGLVVGFASQAVKITVDSLMQAHVPDSLLGRAFAFYDVVYNAGLVCGALVGAVVLPVDGRTIGPGLAIGLLYALLFLAVPAAWRRATERDHARTLG